MKKLIHALTAFYFSLPNLIQVFLILLVYLVLQGLPSVLLIMNSEKLGIWWIVILILYSVLILSLTGLILYRREIRSLKAQYGTEFVYRAFPREKRRDERKQKK